MDRKGNKIVFSPAEQTAFNVAPEVAVASGLMTSRVFLEIATGLIDQAEALTDSTNIHSVNRRNQLTTRAAELSRFAANIAERCAPEIIEEELRGINTDPPA